MDGFFSAIALGLAVVLLLPLIVGGVFVVVVVANRADPDPSGRRPALVYALGTAFFTLFTTLIATTVAVASLSRLIGSHDGRMPRVYSDFSSDEIGAFSFTGGHQHPLGDAVARATVLSLIIALVAGLVCALHLRAAARASAGLATPVDPLARVRSSYVSAVSFVCVLIIVGASVVVLYDIFRGAAPGVFSGSGHGGSVEVLRSMIPAFYLALAATAILFAHLRLAPPPFRPGLLSRWPDEPPPEPVVSPPTPGTETLERAPRTSRRPSPRKPPDD